jgi:hypothetical protein
MRPATAAGLIVVALNPAPAFAQTAPSISNTDLARESENPVTLLATLPLRYLPAERRLGAHRAYQAPGHFAAAEEA